MEVVANLILVGLIWKLVEPKEEKLPHLTVRSKG